MVIDCQSQMRPVDKTLITLLHRFLKLAPRILATLLLTRLDTINLCF
jgi:hypothetical protein